MGQHEIARRLVNGVWTTIDVLEDGGGPGGDWGGASSAQFSGSGTPVGNVTPSAEGDLYVDTTTPALWQATGVTNADWQQVGQGGTQPADDEGLNKVLTVVAVVAQPTFDQVLEARPELLVTGWSANHDYAADLGTADGVQYLKPTGSSNLFAAEVTPGSQSGGSEPNWAGAPNPGDSVSDNDYTWYNGGPFGSFPPAPTTWEAETGYTFPAFVWPTVPSGRLQALFPPGPATSGANEPIWANNGTYIDDGDGYWSDLGAAPGREADWETVSNLQNVSFISSGDGLVADGFYLVSDGSQHLGFSARNTEALSEFRFFDRPINGYAMFYQSTDGPDSYAGTLVFLQKNNGDGYGKLSFFDGLGVAQQTLARPAGDAGALWDILNSYGLVKAP